MKPICGCGAVATIIWGQAWLCADCYHDKISDLAGNHAEIQGQKISRDDYAELCAAIRDVVRAERKRLDPLANVPPATDAEIAAVKAAQEANRRETA